MTVSLNGAVLIQAELRHFSWLIRTKRFGRHSVTLQLQPTDGPKLLGRQFFVASDVEVTSAVEPRAKFKSLTGKFLTSRQIEVRDTQVEGSSVDNLFPRASGRSTDSNFLTLACVQVGSAVYTANASGTIESQRSIWSFNLTLDAPVECIAPTPTPTPTPTPSPVASATDTPTTTPTPTSPAPPVATNTPVPPTNTPTPEPGINPTGQWGVSFQKTGGICAAYPANSFTDDWTVPLAGEAGGLLTIDIRQSSNNVFLRGTFDPKTGEFNVSNEFETARGNFTPRLVEIIRYTFTSDLCNAILEFNGSGSKTGG